MLCPYCGKEVHFTELLRETGRLSSEEMVLADHTRPGFFHVFRGGFCPACHGAVVLYLCLTSTSPGRPTGDHYEINDFKEIVFPANKALKTIPPEVPTEYRSDFDEARRVLDLSPKSSAALSRRLLQRVLHSEFSIKRPDLHKEIQDFINTVKPPTHLSEQLDTIRVIGNFAAHPLKDTATGEIHDVEPGEAEWLVETLENLFDFAFVQPAKSAARKAAINAKLIAAGKPPIP